jgi:hypothetical protein
VTPPQQDGGERSPSEEEPGCEARREVQRKIYNTRHDPDAQAFLQLVPGVLQPQHKQKQKDTDLRICADKVLTEPKRSQTATAKRKTPN